VPHPTLEREAALWAKGFEIVAGLDEVGRGPLAGPVVAAAVVFRPGQAGIAGLRDSKVLRAVDRTRLAEEIRGVAWRFALGAASVREIDHLNIRCATALAMRRALTRLRVVPEYILIDGTPLPELEVAHESVVGGDATCQSVAAAAVLAKCVRDELMLRLAPRHPRFRWDENKGYGTQEHLSELRRAGPTPHHRLSFAPIAQPRLL
jgi:ribonuclease HII